MSINHIEVKTTVTNKIEVGSVISIAQSPFSKEVILSFDDLSSRDNLRQEDHPGLGITTIAYDELTISNSNPQLNKYYFKDKGCGEGQRIGITTSDLRSLHETVKVKTSTMYYIDK